MKINTSSSVVIRILLWIVMLFGGAWYAIAQDIENPYFQSIPFHMLTSILGVIITFFAFKASANGGRELSKGRKGDIPRLETNQLVTTGIYSCMRHPMLFGLTLLPLGWALLLGSPTFISFVAPLEMLFIIFMVLIFEEMECKKKFGDAYLEYSKRVPMVCLRRECLWRLFLK